MNAFDAIRLIGSPQAHSPRGPSAGSDKARINVPPFAYQKKKEPKIIEISISDRKTRGTIVLNTLDPLISQGSPALAFASIHISIRSARHKGTISQDARLETCPHRARVQDDQEIAQGTNPSIIR
jgi:hypothetical protein